MAGNRDPRATSSERYSFKSGRLLFRASQFSRRSKMDNQRLVDLFNKIHQFDTWGFAVLDLEGEPVVVTEGSISTRSILNAVKFDIMCKLGTAEIILAEAQEKVAILTRYRSEIAEHCKEAGVKPPYGSDLI